jgi:hypothetical protein
MTEPVTTAVVAALVDKTVDGLTNAGRAAYTALVQLVRSKLGSREDSQAIMGRAEATPGDVMCRKALAEHLHRAAADDGQFAEELHRLWQAFQNAHASATESGVLNTVAGDVGGNVVQARDVRGGITFGRK